ncbi:MAG: RNA polymerase sigma factor [bacterium]
MTNAQLIHKFLAGDMNAFNTLVWRWEKNLYNFVFRYIGNREDAKDICQQTFIRVYRKLHHLRDVNRFSTWLFQIAVNLCRDEIKKQERRNSVSLEQLNENNNGVESSLAGIKNDDQSDPEKRVNDHVLYDLINRALQNIPEEQRVVIIMKEYQGLKFTEIADILETSVNTTKSRMYYGLTALRKVFKQWKITEESVRYEM